MRLFFNVDEISNVFTLNIVALKPLDDTQLLGLLQHPNLILNEFTRDQKNRKYAHTLSLCIEQLRTNLIQLFIDRGIHWSRYDDVYIIVYRFKVHCSLKWVDAEISADLTCP